MADRCSTLGIIKNLRFDILRIEQSEEVSRDHALWGLVPHLIDTYIDLEQTGQLEHECFSDFESVLWSLTDEDHRGPRAWAEWWLETNGD